MSIFPTHILLATDGSEQADLAATVAADLAQSTGSRLHVVAVGRTFPTAVYEAYVQKKHEELEREAREVLDEQVRKIEAAGGDVALAHLKMDKRRNEARQPRIRGDEAGPHGQRRRLRRPPRPLPGPRSAPDPRSQQSFLK